MSCNCQEIAENGKKKVEESLAMKLIEDSKKQSIRWFTAWVITFLTLLTILGGIVYYMLTSEIDFESVDIGAENGIANYIGNDNNGDISNGLYKSKEDK